MSPTSQYQPDERQQEWCESSKCDDGAGPRLGQQRPAEWSAKMTTIRIATLEKRIATGQTCVSQVQELTSKSVSVGERKRSPVGQL